MKRKQSDTAVSGIFRTTRTVTYRCGCAMAILALSAFSMSSALAADSPENVTSKQYSSTAGEIFWDRVSGPVIGYEITRNGLNLGVVDGNSFYDDTLQADTRYTYTVASVEADETRSTAVPTVFGPFETATDVLSDFSVEVYSFTSAELFWNRPQATGLQYEVTINNVEVINTDGISLYFNSLNPDTVYNVSIRTTNLTTGLDSPVREIQFTTDSEFISGLEPPANVNVAIYSATAAEIFWDRVNENAPAYEISLNGELLNDGSPTFATSVFLENLAAGSFNTISVVAIDAANNQRSLPVETSFETATGDGFNPQNDSPINTDSAPILFEFVLNTIALNAHERVKEGLVGFRFADADDPLPGLTLTDSESTDVGGGTRIFRDTYACVGGGTFTNESIRNAFGDAIVMFDNCVLPDTARDGSVQLTFDGSTLRSDYEQYSETQFSPNSRENLDIEINGQAQDGGSRTGTSKQAFLSDLDTLISGRAGESRVTGMQQLVAADDDSSTSNRFRTAFAIEAFWTRESVLIVETPVEFEGIDADTGRYTSGVLRVSDASSPTTLFEVDAGTGDAGTFQLVVLSGDAISTQLLSWDDLAPLELPCVLTGNEETGPTICR